MSAKISSLTPVVSTAQAPADHPRLGESLVSPIITGHHQGAPGVSLTRVTPRSPGTQHGVRDEITSVKLQREKLGFLEEFLLIPKIQFNG